MTQFVGGEALSRVANQVLLEPRAVSPKDVAHAP